MSRDTRDPLPAIGARLRVSYFTKAQFDRMRATRIQEDKTCVDGHVAYVFRAGTLPPREDVQTAYAPFPSDERAYAFCFRAATMDRVVIRYNKDGSPAHLVIPWQTFHHFSIEVEPILAQQADTECDNCEGEGCNDCVGTGRHTDPLTPNQMDATVDAVLHPTPEQGLTP